MLFVFYFCSYFKNKTIEWRITDQLIYRGIDKHFNNMRGLINIHLHSYTMAKIQ